MSNIVVLKLVSGEEVIGTASENNLPNEHSDFVELENVLSVQLTMNQQTGKIGFGFLPYSPLTEDKKKFKKEHIMQINKPKDTLENAYKDLTGQIITPNKGLLLG